MEAPLTPAWRSAFFTTTAAVTPNAPPASISQVCAQLGPGRVAKVVLGKEGGLSDAAAVAPTAPPASISHVGV